MNIRFFNTTVMMFLISLLFSCGSSEINSVQSARQYAFGTWYAEKTVEDSVMTKWRTIFNKDGSCELGEITAYNLAKFGWDSMEILEGKWSVLKEYATDDGIEIYFIDIRYISNNGTEVQIDYLYYDDNGENVLTFANFGNAITFRKAKLDKQWRM